MANYIITLLTKACNRVNLVRAASAAGFKVSGNPKHPAKYVCPLCKAEQTARAGENANPGALRVAYTTAHLFTHPDGRKMMACCAGHRRLLISDAHPDFENVKGLAVKVEAESPKNSPVKSLETPAPQAPTPPPPATPTKQRCRGTNTKGGRCAATALDNGYCRYHQNQAPATPQNPGF